jgi:hypothetical protein
MGVGRRQEEEQEDIYEIQRNLLNSCPDTILDYN